MDQPSEQRDHVVVTVFPPAPDASVASSSAAAALGFQASGVALPTAEVGSANPHPPRRRRRDAPQRPRNSSPRRPWRGVFNFNTYDLCSTSIQIILLVVFFVVFRSEDPDFPLKLWAIGYGAGCVAMLALLCCTFLFQRRLPRETQPYRIPLEAFFTTALAYTPSMSPRHRRFGEILRCLWRILDGCFTIWFFVGTGFVSERVVAKQAPRFIRLCIGLLTYSYLRFTLPWIFYFVLRLCGVAPDEAPQVGFLPVPHGKSRGAPAEVISALPTRKFQPPNSGGGQDAADAGVEDCCICLDEYEEGVEVKELPCSHTFHSQCIHHWLRINRVCPICKSLIWKKEVGEIFPMDAAFWRRLRELRTL